MRGSTFTENVTFVVETCFSCGVHFAMEQEYRNRKLAKAYDGWASATQTQRDDAAFYCPNGHGQHYIGKSDKQKAREAEEEANRQRGLRRMAEEETARVKVATERERKRILRRANAGVCQDCHRTFSDVAKHRATKHGDEAARKMTAAPKKRAR